MSFKDLIKTIKMGQVKQLIIWFFKHPFFLVATVYATLITIRIAQREFPGIHGKHNKANAFRHAFWNVLIAKKCRRFSNHLPKVMNWTTTFTNWHEDFVKNKDLPRFMDLHNNAIGRKLFVAWKDQNTESLIKLLKVELSNAKKISKINNLNQIENLVFLED